jgi:anti-sigma factor RsiW
MINLPNNNDDVHLLTGAYVVNALDEVERRRFEQHLASCHSCQDEVASLRFTVDDLAGATATEPPMSLKASVLDEVGRTRQVSAARGRSRSGASFARLASAAAIVAALGLGGFALQPPTPASFALPAQAAQPNSRTRRRSARASSLPTASLPPRPVARTRHGRSKTALHGHSAPSPQPRANPAPCGFVAFRPRALSLP